MTPHAPLLPHRGTPKGRRGRQLAGSRRTAAPLPGFAGNPPQWGEINIVVTDDPSSGRFEGREHRLPVRIYYEDTDFTGLVYHANYVRFFERGRSDYPAAGRHQP